MTSLLHGLFEDKCVVDDREPILTFSVNETNFGLFAPRFEPWKQLALFTTIQAVIQAVFAVFIYKFIVKRRRTTEAYLIGWGIVIPLSLYLPFFLLHLLDIRSKVISLAASTLMTCIFFRCIEAMYGTTPAVIESSVQNYMAYYTTPVSFVWDEKTKSRKKVTLHKLTSFVLEIAFYFTSASFVLSFLLHYNFRPFGGSVKLDSFTLSWDLLAPSHILNAYFHTLLIYFTLSTGFNLTALNSMLQGWDTQRIFDSPLLLSRTPSEFWTRRWNTMIHKVLKTGVFLPLKQHLNTTVAVFITLVVSGLYHEYAWYTMFYNHPERYQNGVCETCYYHHFGRVTALFWYFALLMILERPIGKLAPFQWMSRNLPRPVIAHFLILICLPLNFWYYGDWIEAGYFHNFSICLWLIRSI